MNDEFQPVSDDEGVPAPEVPETGFVDGTTKAMFTEAESETIYVEEQSSTAMFVEQPVEAVEVATLHVKVEPSFWEKLRWLVREDRELLAKRIAHLDRAIEASPNAAVNYVQRGELYLQSREYELALADFERGLELAEAQFEASDWGIIAQAMQDRALNGLQKTARKERKRSAN